MFIQLMRKPAARVSAGASRLASAAPVALAAAASSSRSSSSSRPGLLGFASFSLKSRFAELVFASAGARFASMK
jgi:hypothetical protein